MENLHVGQSVLVNRITVALEMLEKGDSNGKNVIKLETHKKKAIIATIPKMPSAMSKVFTKENILKGFTANGQLDTTQQIVPSSKNLLETYRGDVDGTDLHNRDLIMSNYYREMYLEGNIKESTHELFDIAMDKNSKGEKVARDYTVSSENRQRAKVLSSKFQRQERVALINNNLRSSHAKSIQRCDNDDDLYHENDKCEQFLLNNYKILSHDLIISDQSQNINEMTFINIRNHLSKKHFENESGTSKAVKDKCKMPLVRHLKAFLKVRGCKVLSGVKAELITRSLEYKNKPVLPKVHNRSALPPLNLLPDVIPQLRNI